MMCILDKTRWSGVDSLSIVTALVVGQREEVKPVVKLMVLCGVSVFLRLSSFQVFCQDVTVFIAYYFHFVITSCKHENRNKKVLTGM